LLPKIHFSFQIKEKIESNSHVPVSPKTSLLLSGTPHASPSVVFLSLRYLQHIAFFLLIEFLFDMAKAKNQRAVNADPQIKPPKAK
jgi:hypothetical protein